MSDPDPIYLDYAATTPLDPHVLEAMQQAYAAPPANPASQHRAGRKARRVLEEARERVAQLLGAEIAGMNSDRVLFTSGGTEANQLALLGLAGLQPKRILISAIEHSSLRGAAKYLQSRGIQVDTIPVTPQGLCDLNRFTELLDQAPTPQLVSVIHTNNETGIIQPTELLCQLCNERDIPFHTDAAHAMEHWVSAALPFFTARNYSAMTIVPHKFQGPVGIAALMVRHGVPFEPPFPGGFHQGGWRAGTESVPLAVGFRTALEQLAAENFSGTHATLRHAFESRLQAELDEVEIVGAEVPRAPHISNIAFLGVDRQQLFLALDLAGVSCSTGSACASGSSEPSPVLLAMGLPQRVVSSSLRFSFGAPTTLSEVNLAIDRILKCVNNLRLRKSAGK